ncbi:MAG: D-alanyl-D-alanine carboxypeptidase [Cyanothece sp. SIO1E1]|nr:D-alanyl-D-alanine carboxypeptidase [Cyanothece sp. SIO1E1]
MLQLFGSGLLSLWLDQANVQPWVPGTLINWWERTWVVDIPDPEAEIIVQQYLQRLSDSGLDKWNQGIWLQSGNRSVFNHQGTVPLSAASITKIATSLAALVTWGPEYQFETWLGVTGPIENGVLQGDLVVQGRGDPFFGWEAAIALGNSLQQAGINRVTGNLVITGNFAMNFELDPLTAGELLRQGLNAQLWPTATLGQHAALPAGTPQPEVIIEGAVQSQPLATITGQVSQPIVRHPSSPLVNILKGMNVYSNNVMADILAHNLGGAEVVAQRAAQLARVPAEEIRLINGSGLGAENQISPRAAVAMLMAIQRYCRPYGMNVTDLFPISGQDIGTLIDRQVPPSATVKTGTLWNVSALAGVLPTRNRGLVWFAILNGGTGIENLRSQQDILLQALVQHWGAASPIPSALQPEAQTDQSRSRLRAASRGYAF